MPDNTDLAERIVAEIFFGDTNYRPRFRNVVLTQNWDEAVKSTISVLDAEIAAEHWSK